MLLTIKNLIISADPLGTAQDQNNHFYLYLKWSYFLLQLLLTLCWLDVPNKSLFMLNNNSKKFDCKAMSTIIGVGKKYETMAI